MTNPILGIHHVTAIARDPQANVDFYVGVLGLRLVKRTVNFDDPGTYHLYYGDDTGHPGTILTFFPWPGARHGQRGTGQVTATAFSIPRDSLGYWIERLGDLGVPTEGPERRFEADVLTVYDPDGLDLELVASASADADHLWHGGPVPEACAIRGVHGVTMAVTGCEGTTDFLTGTLGFTLVAEEGNRFRCQRGSGPGAFVDLVCQPTGQPGLVAAGTVHHIAWRVADDETQLAWRTRIADTGLHITPRLDRQYFRSVYFREPGGILFEIATDLPGFTRDEDVSLLGSRLMLPPWLEHRRPELERRLPALTVPGT